MASPVKDAKTKHIAAGFTEITGRGKGWLRSRKPGTQQYALTTQVGNIGWHKGTGPFAEADEIDTAWQVDSGSWDYYTEADFIAQVRDSVPVSYRYEDTATGHYIELTVNTVLWVNDEDDSEAAASFSQVTPTIDDDEITWSGIATGWTVRIQAQTARLAKWLYIDSLANLGSPTIGGTNIRLRFQLTWQKSSGLQVWVDGVQWGEKNNTWAETTGDIEFRDEITQQAIFWFQRPTGYDAGGDVAPMSHRVRRAGANYYSEIDTPWSWLQSATFPISLDTTIDDSVDTGYDDGFTSSQYTTYNRTGATFYAGNWLAGAAGDSDAFFLFGGISGLSGATISVSNFTPNISSHYGGGGGTKLNIYAEDAAGPTSYTNYNQHRNATRTTAFVAWDDETGTGDQQSPSIVSVIQELADSYDPSSIMILLDNDGSADENLWTINAYEGLASWGADLHIEYTTGGATVACAAGSLTLSGQQGSVDAPITIAGATGTLALAGQQGGVKSNILRVMNAGSLALTGQQSSIKSNIIRAVNAGNLALAGQQGAVDAPVTIGAAAGQITFSGQQATIGAALVILINAGALALAGQAGSIKSSILRTMNTGNLALTGQQSSIKSSILRTMNTGNLALAGQQSSIKSDILRTMNAGQLNWIGQQGDIVPGAVAIPMNAGQLTWSGQQAIVSSGAAIIVMNYGSLNLAGQQGDIVPGAVAVPMNAGQLTWNGQQADLVPGAAIIAINYGALAFTGQQGAVDAPITIGSAAGVLTFSGQQVGILAGGALVQAAAGILALAGQQADLVPGAVAILLNAGALVLAGQQGSIKSNILRAINAGNLALTGQQAAVSPGVAGTTIAANAGALALSGQQGIITAPVTIVTSSGTLTLTGQQATIALMFILAALTHGIVYGPKYEGIVWGPGSGEVIGPKDEGVLQ